MHSLILSIAFSACLIIGGLGDEPVEPLSADAPASDQTTFILRILKVIETHDHRTFLDYTLGEAVDYFGHKNATNAYVEQDMKQDARFYRWCRFDPDLGTFQTSLGHDSMEYNSDAMDVRGKEHKARCRLDIYFTPTPSPRLLALSLKVLPIHAPTGNSRPTVIGPATGQDEQSGYEDAIAQGTKIIRTKVIPRYETKDGFSVKPLDIKYENDPMIAEQIKKYGSIWKQLDPVVSDAYTSIQRQVNDKNKPEAKRYRMLLADAFSEAVELRGGGSASGQLLTFAPAHEEWIIAHLGTAQEDDVSDDVFVSRLRKSLTVGGSAERRRVQAVLEKLKAVERFLGKSDAAFLRQEFLAYFAQEAA
jgi:hypothetical protein